MFSYYGRTVSTDTGVDVHKINSGSNATAVIRERAFNNFVNLEGNCAAIVHYLFLSHGEQYIVHGRLLNTVPSMKCFVFHLCTHTASIVINKAHYTGLTHVHAKKLQ